MKKYKSYFDIVLLLGIGLLAFLSVAPNALVMPTSLQMLILGIVLVLIASFLVLFWREDPSDEREASNQASASRSAYIVGFAVLLVAMAWQSFNHHVDSAIPLTIFAMIATKILVQRRKDND